MLGFRRFIGGATAAAVIAGTMAVGIGGANAATTKVTYTCSGITGDVAATQNFFGFITNFTSAQVLANLASIDVLNFPANPEISIDVTSTVPPSVAPGDTFSADFDVAAELPEGLATVARDQLGLSSVAITNASFGVNVSNATPATVSGGFASKTVPLTGGTVTVTDSFGESVTATGAAGSAIGFRPGNARLSIVLNRPFLNLDLRTITVECTPANQLIGATAIIGDGTTTTTTTTTQPTTTTTTTTTTSTTTTTTTTSTTTTTQPTTTTTTTTPAPSGGLDTLTVRLRGGYTYDNGAELTAGNFVISRDGFGISGITGRGTLPGREGGTAVVSVNVNRILFWSFGTITVHDPGAGINNVQSTVFFAATPTGSSSSATIAADSVVFDNGIKSFNTRITVNDAPR